MKLRTERILSAATAVALISLGAAAASPQLPEPARAAIDRYRAAITSAASDSSPRALETAFAAFGSMRDELMRVRDGETVLESLSDQEFNRLERSIPGAVINREEVVFVHPDPDYFLKLAAARGDAADRAFFSAFKATYPDGVWAVYVEQQTDYSGCTRFGTMSLVETYRAWTGFQQAYAARYAKFATQEAQAVLGDLLHSTCACGDIAGVEAELRRFLQEFPAPSPARRDVERRLEAVRARPADIRVKCVSG